MKNSAIESMFNDDGHCNIHQNGYSFNKKNDKNNIIRINLPEVKTSVTIDLKLFNPLF
jgi:hypothetical protein